MGSKMVCVEIVEIKSGRVERRMGPMSERKAERVELGVLANLDMDRFFVRIVGEHEQPSCGGQSCTEEDEDKLAREDHEDDRFYGSGHRVIRKSSPLS